MATWPTLPAPLINTFNESFADNILRTQMDTGPEKVRRRTTANVRKLSFSMLLSESQLDTLASFYNTTTLSGAAEFTYTHPRTGATETARFAEPPSFNDVNGLVYNVAISLEILP